METIVVFLRLLSEKIGGCLQTRHGCRVTNPYILFIPIITAHNQTSLNLRRLQTYGDYFFRIGVCRGELRNFGKYVYNKSINKVSEARVQNYVYSDTSANE